MILTSNRGFADWGEIFGDPVVAAALLDRLLHHAVVIHDEGSSYRLREHAALLPEGLKSRRRRRLAGDRADRARTRRVRRTRDPGVAPFSSAANLVHHWGESIEWED